MRVTRHWLVLIPFSAGLLVAQPVAFEVASIRPSGDAAPITPEDVRAGRARPPMGFEVEDGRFRSWGTPLELLINRAYEVGGPYVFGEGWLKNAKFDVNATFPSGATKAQVPAMLRALLEERFQLKVHREKREAPVYALVEAKGGIKIPELPPDTPKSLTNTATEMVFIGPLDGIGAAASFSGLNTRMVNATGLTGSYRVPLAMRLVFGSRDDRPVLGSVDDSDAVTRMTEALAPLGLKLERRRIVVDAVIVDHAERTPSEN